MNEFDSNAIKCDLVRLTKTLAKTLANTMVAFLCFHTWTLTRNKSRLNSRKPACAREHKVRKSLLLFFI